MGFAQGFTKGFIRQSEMNQARRESEADREFTAQRDTDAFERQKQLAAYESRLSLKQARLLDKLKGDRELADKNSASTEVLRLGKSIFGEKATLALQMDGRLSSVIDSYNERQLTEDDVAAIKFTAEQYADSVPPEVQADFMEALATKGQDAAFGILAQSNLDPMGSLTPKDTLDTLQVTNEVAKFTADLVGASYEVSDGVVKFTPPQDFNATNVRRFQLEMTQRIKELQPTLGFTRAAQQALDEFEPRLEEFGLTPTQVEMPEAMTSEESTRMMGVPSSQPFGSDIDRLLND